MHVMYIVYSMYLLYVCMQVYNTHYICLKLSVWGMGMGMGMHMYYDCAVLINVNIGSTCKKRLHALLV